MQVGSSLEKGTDVTPCRIQPHTTNGTGVACTPSSHSTAYVLVPDRGNTHFIVVAAASTPSVLTDPSRQLRLLIDSVRDHALYLLDPDGIVCSWNPGAERIKGYRSEEVIGTHFGRFYLPADRDTGEPQRLLRLAAECGHHAAEGWRVRRDGSPFRASVVVESVVENGELVGFVKITRDITEQWQAQRLLRDAQRALRQTQQFETVGQLSRGLAHEFNNLLTTIVNALDLLSARMGMTSVPTPCSPPRRRPAIVAHC